MSNWNPWRVLVKYWKKDEYLSWREVFIYQLLNYLLALPVMLVLFSLRHHGNWAFVTWLLIVGTWLLLSLIPQVRARWVKIVNRRVDKKKSKALTEPRS